jgi:hypothetical protein
LKPPESSGGFLFSEGYAAALSSSIGL